ncbi:HAMP domain-containing sensor histidine kinase [Clostridium sp. LP20]|uniref:sensor histidine kinase n=1 Tax=Clostridium sp. LP20 TaxID=3418665 RepID=UPI003EE5D7AF
MRTLRGRLGILFVVCSIAAILLIALFVNITINSKFNEYISNIQEKRYERIVASFEEVYKSQGTWDERSGSELIHEAHMGNYCLSLMDNNKKLIWGMDPNTLKANNTLNTMVVKDKGVYNTKTFEIKSEGEVVGYVEIGHYSSILLSEEDINFKISINKSIIASGILTLLIIIVISLYFSKQFSRPIKEVANMSVNLSQGNFDTKSNIESNIEELESLRGSFNILADKLKYQDTLRKRLVSDISHEIRTPLNILQNNLEAMIDGVFPVTNERLNYLNDEVIRFGELLNNLNILKEFESESIKFNFQSINLEEILIDICKDFEGISENKGIKLICRIAENEDYRITGDRNKLKQVFINLLSNAIKFTNKDGEVFVSLYIKGKNIIVEVKDNGVGIKKEDLPFVFERLYRGDKSRSQIEGSGIGLTIAKSILQVHHAKITVKSEEGKGAAFKIYFSKI